MNIVLQIPESLTLQDTELHNSLIIFLYLYKSDVSHVLKDPDFIYAGLHKSFLNFRK